MFQPVVPFGGFSGWSFLTRTLDNQKEAFANSSEIAREVDYFKENISKIQTAEDLVADRRLLKVALESFGLGEDINNKFFIRKVLEDGTSEDDALANRLSDKRYLEFSKAFGFGDLPAPNTVLSDFGSKITSAFKERQFEAAIGDQNEDFRLALGIERDLTDIAGKDLQEDTLWFTVMGNPPLRKVFETAFNLPESFGALDLDKQLETLKDKAQSAFGDSGIKQFASTEKLKDLTQLFLLRADVQALNLNLGSSQTALTLLQNISIPRTSLF
ncbi:MAG: DUF1217 domain-containing protein [Marinosulfonomonas sp.]|nr:DUF1217 domain-containing protein [Marinosulfonomonas sp.]